MTGLLQSCAHFPSQDWTMLWKVFSNTLKRAIICQWGTPIWFKIHPQNLHSARRCIRIYNQTVQCRMGLALYLDDFITIGLPVTPKYAAPLDIMLPLLCRPPWAYCWRQTRSKERMHNQILRHHTRHTVDGAAPPRRKNTKAQVGHWRVVPQIVGDLKSLIGQLYHTSTVLFWDEW